jgi:hypothetical protein
MRNLATTVAVISMCLSLAPPSAAANDERDRQVWRQLVDAAAFVVEGGNHPRAPYTWSDKGDHDRTLAKNSSLADTTYQNRVVITDMYYMDFKSFVADLRRVGHNEMTGYLMLRGMHYDLHTRIPLAIPSAQTDTCIGVCEVAASWCASSLQITTGIYREGHMEPAVRRCVYNVFRIDFFNTLHLIAAEFGQDERDTWDGALPEAPRSYESWVEHWNAGAMPDVKAKQRFDASVQRAMVIALGTPVSFYSHNPLKPVGYHFDAKNKDSTRQAYTDTLHEDGTLQRGQATCSDFDLKIYWPDMAYDLMQRALEKDLPEVSGRMEQEEEKDPAMLLAFHLLTSDAIKLPPPAAVKFLRDRLPLNLKIVDGGKQHVFKNSAGGGGVYDVYPMLKLFAGRWTAGFGREVDVKLEFSVSQPEYFAMPGGPISVYDARHAPNTKIDVDEERNDESYTAEVLE